MRADAKNSIESKTIVFNRRDVAKSKSDIARKKIRKRPTQKSQRESKLA